MKNTSRLGFVCLLMPILLSAQNYVFGPNVRVNDDPPGQNEHVTVSPGQHWIAARGDTVYLAWTDGRGGGNTHVYFARSLDAGRTFESNVRLSGDQTSDPSLAVDDSGCVLMSFANRNSSGGYFTYYTKSTDGGVSFAQPVRASDSLHRSQGGAASIAASKSGRHVYVARAEAWIDSYPPSTQRIWLSRSTDGGTTFFTPNTLVCPDTSVNMYSPSVAVFQDTLVFVAWRGGPGARTYYARSRNGGTAFEPVQTIDSTHGNDCSIGVDSSGRVYLFEGLGVSISQDTGRSFSRRSPVPIGADPSIWVSPGGKLYLASCRYTVFPKVYLTYSPDGGDTFMTPVNPCDSANVDQIWPAVAANEQGKVFIAWADYRNDPWNKDVYLATGVQSGIAEAGCGLEKLRQLALLPNPACGLVRIEYAHEQSERIRAVVCDQTGREVSVLHEGFARAGRDLFLWNGTDARGRPVSSGVYFVTVSAVSGRTCGKLQYFSD